MPYPGIPKEKTAEMDACVNKVMKKNGKTKDDAIGLCRTSVMNKQTKEKEAYEVVANKDDNYLYFTKSKVNSLQEGTLLKDIEIFKVGTFNGVEFKKSALEKMVANFNYLKAFDIFPHVPVRADHPGFLASDIINKVGGYVADLRLKGNKIVADFRITSAEMLAKIQEGSYISRSAEIGTYEDNTGQVFSPTLYGVAWVDIPAVEGLSSTFSFSKEHKNLIELNHMEETEKDVVELEEKEPETTETVEAETEEVETVVEEVKEDVAEEVATDETPETEEPTDAEDVDTDTKDFAKQFPKEYAEIQALRSAQLDAYVDSLVVEGKVAPANKEYEKKFISMLSQEQLDSYKQLKKETPALVNLNNDMIEDVTSEEPTKSEEVDAEKEAEEFLART